MVHLKAIHIPRAYLPRAQTIWRQHPFGADERLRQRPFQASRCSAACGAAEEQIAAGPVAEHGGQLAVAIRGHFFVVVEGVGDLGLPVEPEGATDAVGVVALAAAGTVG